MRRTKKDLVYLVKTTTVEGTKKDTALFAERELRLVEHGWRKSKFGETTEKGRNLAGSLREFINEKFKGSFTEEDYPDQIKKVVQNEGVTEILTELE